MKIKDFKQIKKCRKFDSVGNRFEFYFDEIKDSFYVTDILLNKVTELEIKVRKYDKFKEVKELKQIRYWFPKPHNINKKYYCKSLSDIKFELFGEYKGKGGSPLSLTIEDCKRIIKEKNEKIGFFSYTDMINSDETLLRKVYTFIRNNGGNLKFIEIINELGLNYQNYYTDNNGVFLKSSFEFIFFSILHFNSIKYEYEPFKIKNFVPDFYIPKDKILIEILGLSTRENYSKKSTIKEELYKSEGYNYKPIVVDRHHPQSSIFKECEEIFGELKLPDFYGYNKKYILTSKEFIEQLRIYLKRINDGELKVTARKDKSGFREKYRKYYNYVIDTYGNLQIGIKELVGIPSTKFKSVRIEKYWMNIDYVKDELENVFKNEKRIPTKYQIRIEFRDKYNIWNFYRFWGEKSLKKGGVFYEFIEELKLKYGYRDIDLENKIQKEKEHTEFLNELQRVVMLVYNDKLSINGEGSLFTNYRPMYHFLFLNYGGVFNYIKQNIGYPPPHILRPTGYYKIDKNVEYELEENWKKFKRILGDAERIRRKNENTYYNMIRLLGTKQFKERGRYFPFIQVLKEKYGYDNSFENKRKKS